MKILQLIIKQKYFDEIIAGTKNQEFREIKPTTESKYLQYAVGEKIYQKIDDVPEEIPEDDIETQPIPYDAIQFYVGYSKGRDSALVEVKGAMIEIFTDEKGNDIVYEQDGVEYYEAQIIYDLGKVLEKNIKSFRN
jgi:hypothetical protein